MYLIFAFFLHKGRVFLFELPIHTEFVRFDYTCTHRNDEVFFFRMEETVSVSQIVSYF